MKPAAFGLASAGSSLRPGVVATEEAEDDGSPRTTSSALFFGLPLALGAVWGVISITTATPLADHDGATFSAKALVGAILIAPAVAALFVRRAYGSLERATAALGASKALTLGLVAAAVALVPAGLSTMAVLYAANGVGSHPRLVECKASSVWRAVDGQGWNISYACDVDGEHLVGTLSQLRTKPEVEDGGRVDFRAARGRLGRWIRLGVPITPATTRP